MLRRIFFIIVFLLIHALHGYSQLVPDDYREVSRLKQELWNAGTTQQKIKLLLELSSLLVVKETDATSIKEAIVYTDKAIALSTVSKDNNHLSEAYLLRSHLAQIQHDYKKGISMAMNAIKLSERLENYNNAGEAYVFLWSNNSLNHMQYEERIPILIKAANSFRAANRKLREADCLAQMADLYQITDQAGLALNCLKRALNLYKEIGHKNVQSTYDLLGVAYLMLGDYKSAIQSGLMALKIADDLGDTTLSLCTFNNRLGLSYLKCNDLINARKYFDQSLEVAIRFNDNDGIFQLTFNIAILLLKQNNSHEALRIITNMVQKYPAIKKKYRGYIACNMITIYKLLKRYDDAKPYLLLVEEMIRRDTSNSYAIVHAYGNIIPFYIQTGNLERAALYTRQLRAACIKKNLTGSIEDCYIFQFKIDSAKGNYLSAIRNYQHYNELKDSIFDKEKRQQINQLSLFFETEKKDHDIQVLKNESQLQQSHLKQATLMRNLYSGGSVLLLIILLLLFYGFSSKQKANRMLRHQQDVIKVKNDSLQHLLTEKEWLIKEIHHRVKNNLHMVVGLLSSQTEFLEGEEALSAIKDSQHRIQAMSLIHQKLYQNESLSYTEMPSYIFDLTEYIKDAYGKDVNILLDIASVEFTLAYSIPIGLILNEAITNAIKYAFPDGEKGTVKVALENAIGNDYMLSIKDNGIGLPGDFNENECMSLGLNLMKGLSTDLNGSFSISGDNGTSIEIIFSAEGVKQNA